MDIGQTIDEAHTSILEASAAIQALTSRPGGPQSLPFRDIGTAVLPVIARFKLAIAEIGGTGDNREVVARFAVFAEGNGAQATARALIEQIELAITQPAYAARNVDACVLPGGRVRDEPEEDPGGERALARSDITLRIWATKPLP